MRGIGIAALSALAFHGHSASAGAISAPSRQTQEKPALEEDIVSDETFQSSLPELAADDDELDEALESMDAFKRRFDAGEPSETDADPAAESAAPAAEPLGMPRFTDPELAQPLSPLEEFEALPLDFSRAAAQNDTADTEPRYRWEITGLAEADAQTSIDLEDQFEALSALEQGDGKAANTAMLTARLADDKALLTRILRAEGWYMAEVEGRLAPGQPDDKVAAIASLTVEAGPRFTLSQIVIAQQADVGTTIAGELLQMADATKNGETDVEAASEKAVALISEGTARKGG